MIHRISKGEAEQRGFYRFLHNPRVSEEELKDEIYQDCLRQVEAGGHYLVIEDTTQPNFERNRDNIRDRSGLGLIGDNASLGFFLHPSLVVEATSGQCLGYSHIHHWSRQKKEDVVPGQKGKGRWSYQERPIEEKESYRWLESALKSKERLKGAGKLTVVCDREGDIWEFLQTVSQRGMDFLVRCKHNRNLQSNEGQLALPQLFTYLAQSPSLGQCTLVIKGDERKKRQGREAKLTIRCAPINVPSPDKDGQVVQLYALEAHEDPSTVPAGESPIHWRLLTTHVVQDLAQACMVIHWYTQRWNIEQIFRLIKTKGMNVEASDLESGPALIKLTLLSLLAVVKVMLLHLASKTPLPQPIRKAFSHEEMLCLTAICSQYEGKTTKQQNPYPHDSLQWCYWVLARMGGWKPHEKQAGVICLFRGWQDFIQIFSGWSLARNVVS